MVKHLVKKMFVALIDSEKAYDRVSRKALWEVLGIYGGGGKLIKAIQSTYFGSKAAIRVIGTMSQWFEQKIGLKQRCGIVTLAVQHIAV